MNGFWAAMIGWSFAIALFVIWRLFRCHHEWQLVDKTEMPPPIQAIQKAGLQNDVSYWPSDLKSLCGMTVVLALRCSKCGAAKIRKVTQN